MEQDQSSSDGSPKPVNGEKAGGFAACRHHLCTVTPFSKLVAAVVFIALPFLGAYVGYMYAPEKMVEVEVLIKNTQVGTEELVEEVQSDETNSFDFIDEEVGISFSYPADWGPVLTDNEVPTQYYDEVANEYVPFDCLEEYTGDPCNFRTFLFKYVTSDSVNIFMTAETFGHHDNPIGRGGFWGDLAGDIGPDYKEVCEADAKCELYTNRNGVTFAYYRADPPPEEMGYQPERYYVYNPASPYYGLVLSPHRIQSDLKGNVIDSEVFRDTVIESFQFKESVL